MNQKQQLQLTPLDGIRYFTPPAGYLLSGRDGLVAIPWEGKPAIPLLEEDFAALGSDGQPDYDMVGRGIYQTLRLNPECGGAAEYATVLKDAYPHIVSELGGQIIMLEAKEVDTELQCQFHFILPAVRGLVRECEISFVAAELGDVAFDFVHFHLNVTVGVGSVVRDLADNPVHLRCAIICPFIDRHLASSDRHDPISAGILAEHSVNIEFLVIGMDKHRGDAWRKGSEFGAVLSHDDELG